MDLKNLLTVEVILMAVVLVVIITASIIILAKMKPLRDFDNIKFGKLELTKGKKDMERDKQQDNAINEIKEELKEINKRLDAQYIYLREAAVQSGIGVVWSGAKAPFEETIRAALNNIKLGENGNLIGRVVTVIMEEGKNGVTNYRSELNRFINENFTKPKKDMPEHFSKMIKAIDSEIH